MARWLGLNSCGNNESAQKG